MPTYTKPDYSSTCRILERELSGYASRIKVSEQNTKLKNTIQEKIDTFGRGMIVCNTLLDLVKPILADTKTYINNKRQESMNNINNALRLAGEIIKDSADGIYFQLDGDEAWLSTQDGLEVDMTEGGGYRQISSTFIRSAVLSANSHNLQTLFLDEMFATVSVQNSSVLSLYLNVICKNMQVISIEQKPQVYSNVDTRVYSFNKVGDYTLTKRYDIVRDTPEALKAGDK